MILLMILALAAIQDSGSGKLQLTCRGGGAANKQSNKSIYATDSDGNSGWAAVQGRRSEGFDDQVDLWIEGDAGRIRLPRTMLPPIHGGEDGWIKLSKIAMADDSITASAAVNALNHPKIHVDRHSGVISIDGKAGHFVGQCERFDPTAQPRKF